MPTERGIKFAVCSSDSKNKQERTRKNMEVIPYTSKGVMTLPAKAQGNAASDKEGARLKRNSVYTLLSMTAVPVGHKIIGSRWVYNVKADNSYMGRVSILGWG